MPDAKAALASQPEINRGYLDTIRAWSVGGGAGTRAYLRSLVGRVLRTGALPLLIATAVAEIVWLRLYLLVRRSHRSALHTEALAYVDSFVEQYPLHLYPIVAKSLELSYLKRRLPTMLQPDAKVLEVAIGEGTLSERVFTSGQQVVGLDLNPYSLSKAAVKPHVRRAVICDGLRPPVNPGAFDLLISNNLLHHVTQKNSTIESWAKVAPTLLFNENTPYWASGWTVPYLLSKFGLTEAARRAAHKIETEGLQHLEPVEKLRSYVAAHCELEEERAFFSEKTYFLCSLFSFFMICYGPPTPAFLKRLFLGPLRWLALPLTRSVARLLIRYDGLQDTSTATFVYFSGRSRYERDPVSDADEFLCPSCRGALDQNHRCRGCGAAYKVKDAMLFLVTPELERVFSDYVSERSAAISGEHL